MSNKCLNIKLYCNRNKSCLLYTSICIPEYFNLFNKRKQNLSKGKSTEYDDLKNEHGKPYDCIECGQCERVCPQKLPIISNLKKVADEFE